MEEIKLGKYQHSKGEFYEVLNVARHSETSEEFVIYRALSNPPESGENAPWTARPKKMFLENVIRDAESVPRFKYIGPINS